MNSTGAKIRAEPAAQEIQKEFPSPPNILARVEAEKAAAAAHEEREREARKALAAASASSCLKEQEVASRDTEGGPVRDPQLEASIMIGGKLHTLKIAEE